MKMPFLQIRYIYIYIYIYSIAIEKLGDEDIDRFWTAIAYGLPTVCQMGCRSSGHLLWVGLSAAAQHRAHGIHDILLESLTFISHTTAIQ